MFNQKLKAELALLKTELAESHRAADSLKSELLYWQLSPKGIVDSVGQKTLNTLNCSASLLQGKAFVEMVCDPERKSPAYQQLVSAIQQHRAFSGSSVLNCGNADVSVHLIVQPHFSSAGHCLQIDIFGCKLDICSRASQSNEDILEALDRSMAIIEFEPNGQIINANSLFLQTTGYSLPEIVGKHHRIFCPNSVTDNSDYERMWEALASGSFISGRFERLDKSGQTVWLEASYNPVIDDSGKVYKVIKFASNVSQQVKNEQRVKEAAELASSMSAETGAQADKGQRTMTETVGSLSSLTEQMSKASAEISELEQQSSELNKMVTAISAIADQTNLLALNAAIEAARAGEQGRGFAVVADEVRELASRTTQSTKDIMAVFSRNDQSTKDAVNTIRQGLETLSKVAHSIEETKLSMGEIEAGAKKVISAVDQLSEP